MKKGIKQITEGEIHEIRILLKEGNSIPEVAKKVGRNKTTIYRLLQVNGINYNETKYKYIGGKGGIKENKEKYLKTDGKRKIQFHPRTVFLKILQRVRLVFKTPNTKPEGSVTVITRVNITDRIEEQATSVFTTNTRRPVEPVILMIIKVSSQKITATRKPKS